MFSFCKYTSIYTPSWFSKSHPTVLGRRRRRRRRCAQCVETSAVRYCVSWSGPSADKGCRSDGELLAKSFARVSMEKVNVTPSDPSRPGTNALNCSLSVHFWRIKVKLHPTVSTRKDKLTPVLSKNIPCLFRKQKKEIFFRDFLSIISKKKND